MGLAADRKLGPTLADVHPSKTLRAAKMAVQDLRKGRYNVV